MNQQLLDELISMEQRDVDTRPRLVRKGQLYDDYADELQHVHREDAHRLNDSSRNMAGRRFQRLGLRAAARPG